MKLFQVIENAKASGVWNYLVAASDWAFQKDLQYTIFSLVQELEPSRSYGYRKRILSYLIENKVVTGGGYSVPCGLDDYAIIRAINEMEREITDFSSLN